MISMSQHNQNIHVFDTYTLKQTGTNFRSLSVQSNGNGHIGNAQLLAGNLRSLTHILNGLRMVLLRESKWVF